MRLKREWMYATIGVLLALILLWYLASTLGFLARELGGAFNPSLIKTEDVARFNLDKMKELHIPGVE